MKRTEYFAYTISSYQSSVLHFTRHFSYYSAQRYYGDLSKHYRGTSSSDYTLSILTHEKMEETFIPDLYSIDWKAKIITKKP